MAMILQSNVILCRLVTARLCDRLWGEHTTNYTKGSDATANRALESCWIIDGKVGDKTIYIGANLEGRS